MGERALLSNVLAFVRGLRRIGFAAGPDRVALALRALHAVGMEGWPHDARDAFRTVLAGDREEAALFDTAWEQFCFLLTGSRDSPLAGQTLLAHVARQRFRRRRPPRVIWAGGTDSAREGETGSPETPAVLAFGGASPAQALRHKDFAALTEAEQREMERWADRARWPLWRSSRRRRPHRRGREWDPSATLRAYTSRGGEIVQLMRRRSRRAPRPVVILCDVSGSMEPYSRMVLRFAKSLVRVGHPLEVFAFSTELVRLTPALRLERADRALEQAVAMIPDFGGGTRLAECLALFNRRWARRVMRRGAVAVIVSDGLEAGDPRQLAEEMARLARWSRAIAWLNPDAGRPGYRPAAAGMAAALPYVDGFWPGHTWFSLEQAWGKLAELERRPGTAPPFPSHPAEENARAEKTP